jgi:hypothetical protein
MKASEYDREDARTEVDDRIPGTSALACSIHLT